MNTNADSTAARNLMLRGKSLWARGKNRYGQLGTKPEELDSWFNSIDQLSAAWLSPFRSYALQEDGSLMVSGDNQLGQLGLAEPSIRQWQASLSGVKRVYPTELGALALGQNGELYAAGQIAGAAPDTTGWQQVMSNVVAAASNAYSSFAIDQDGALWGIGANRFGELGTGDTQMLSDWRKLMDNVADIYLSDTSAIAISRDNQLWQAGSLVTTSNTGWTVSGNITTAPEQVSDSMVFALDSGVQLELPQAEQRPIPSVADLQSSETSETEQYGAELSADISGLPTPLTLSGKVTGKLRQDGAYLLQGNISAYLGRVSLSQATLRITNDSISIQAGWLGLSLVLNGDFNQGLNWSGAVQHRFHVSYQTPSVSVRNPLNGKKMNIGGLRISVTVNMHINLSITQQDVKCNLEASFNFMGIDQSLSLGLSVVPATLPEAEAAMRAAVIKFIQDNLPLGDDNPVDNLLDFLGNGLLAAPEMAGELLTKTFEVGYDAIANALSMRHSPLQVVAGLGSIKAPAVMVANFLKGQNIPNIGQELFKANYLDSDVVKGLLSVGAPVGEIAEVLNQYRSPNPASAMKAAGMAISSIKSGLESINFPNIGGALEGAGFSPESINSVLPGFAGDIGGGY